MELILQADGQAVKGTEWFSSFGVVIVEHTGGFERSVEEDFMQAVYLFSCLVERNTN